MDTKCEICGSWNWCGRPCANAPKPKKPRAKAARKDDKQKQCFRCGGDFSGSYERLYCSDACRQAAWRDRASRKKEHISKQLLLSWGQARFAAMERDGFKCRYCGRGSAQNAVLHVDHIVPKSAGGTHDLENLLTACSECNYGKGSALIDNRPE